MEATMARKSLMSVAVLAMVVVMICCFHVKSVAGGEMGGYAVQKGRSSGSSSSSSSGYHSQHHYYSSCGGRHCPIQDSSPYPASTEANSSGGESSYVGRVIVALIFSFPVLYAFLPLLFGKDSVLVLQVCFNGATEQICGDLDLIALTRDSPSPDSRTPGGLHLLLSETASCLYRHGRKSSFSADSNVMKKRQLTGWKKSFDLKYNQELKKLHAHVHANDCGEGPTGNRATCRDHKYIVVTILVAANGSYELPAINCYSDFERALRSLTSIAHSRIEAIKVLWTSRDDMEDFKFLMPIQM